MTGAGAPPNRGKTLVLGGRATGLPAALDHSSAAGMSILDAHSKLSVVQVTYKFVSLPGRRATITQPAVLVRASTEVTLACLL